ncbi:MAG TPA: penicillin-binding protein 2 [Rhodospirillaceae bacterium]|nr:penicillin-binding protein 2 [Rhodospirillaceae bacterium]
MRKNQDSTRVFTRRSFVVGALQVGFLAVLGGRLAWLQVAQGSRYRTLSDQNRINVKILPPSRGQIVDRFGVPLALNNQNYRVLIIPEQTDSIEKSLRSLQALIELKEEKIKKVLKQVKASPKFVPIEVRDDLSWEDVAKIEVNLPDLPGLAIDVGEIRSYPFGASTAHIVGYVSGVSQTEDSEDPVLKIPGFKVGKTGIEKTFDLELRGKPGNAEVEVNVVGREVRELRREPSKEGDRIVLTIDGELQRFTQGRIEQERSASAVVMDAHTGAVYALASNPGFDPNVFSKGLSAATWEELLADPGRPLTNKAIAGQYPPGSTFKMVTALAALELGMITSNTSFFCPGHYKFGDGKFHCWKKGGHGTVNLIDALAQSCDVFFYEISTKIGIDKIAETAKRLGLGHKLDFELREEKPGLIPDKNWKEANFGETWQPGETIVASIGQGYMQATPLQLAVMTARLVNGGRAVKPWIAAYAGDKFVGHDSNWPDMGLDKWHMELIRKGMDSVVNHERGTAKGSRIEEPGMEMGGKTGTAQVKRITMKQRLEGVLNEDLPWNFRHHALFVGYAPLDKPRYVCSVVVEHGGGGSTAAAPLAKELMIEVQRRDPAATQPQMEKRV